MQLCPHPHSAVLGPFGAKWTACSIRAPTVPQFGLIPISRLFLIASQPRGALDGKTKFSQAARTSRHELHRGHGQIFTVLEYFVDARVTRKPVAFSDLAKALPSPAPPSIASSILWKSWRIWRRTGLNIIWQPSSSVSLGPLLIPAGRSLSRRK